MAIVLRTHVPSFRHLLENRYTGFVKAPGDSHFEFDIDLYEPDEGMSVDDDARVRIQR